MATPVPWLALGALLAGVLSLSFLRFLWPYRDRPGARFFIGTVACEAIWALSYGLALFVFDPGLRMAFEIPIWLGINFIGVFFLAFALQYTGRGDLVRSKLMAVVVGVQTVHTVIVATNPIHHIAWTGYTIEPILGAATVSYVHQPWLFVNFAGIYVLVAAASFLLLETFYSYGRLYRAQTIALALSPTLPGLAFTLWLFEVGISPPLNLTPFTFPIHLAFDGFAFFRRNLFELTPAARRAGDRAAIDDLASPVVVLDDDRRIVNSNAEASDAFSDGDALRGRHLGSILPDVDPAAANQTVSIRADGANREYAIEASPLVDAAGNAIGDTLVFQDITDEKRREQRLSVLNRVLRHNLRNDLNVVRANIDVANRQLDDGDAKAALNRAELKTEEVIDLGEKARTVEQLLDGDRAVSEPVALGPLLSEVCTDVRSEGSNVDIRLDVDDGERVQSDPATLRAVFENVLENAAEHGASTVDIDVDTTADTDWVTIEMRDDGPGIPDHERRPIETGKETALEHGSGLGLWIVSWGVASLGGDIEFESDSTGTMVRISLPLADEADE